MPARPLGVVLVLHGGAGRRADLAVRPSQLSVLRMIPIARRIGHLGRGRLAVFRLLNSSRGWDTRRTPVEDASWALGEVAERLAMRVPACLVGHSLGGRAAILAAGRDEVSGVVGLAPWVAPDDAPQGLAGKRVLFVHGSNDRVASPERAAALARKLSRQARVGYITVAGGGHAMLKRHAVFDGLAAQFVASVLLGAPSGGPLARIEAGEAWIRV